jgi:hypothetical protein
MPNRFKVFLLGGHDLEMDAIRTVLEDCGYEEGVGFYDKGLSWSDATIDTYAEIIDGIDSDTDIYAVELRDAEKYAERFNFHIIDHHNAYSQNESSLLQVLKLFGKKPTDEERRIAINDEGHIAGLLAHGYDENTIKKIRREDRIAQGINPRTFERIRQNLASAKRRTAGDIAVIEVPDNRFSAYLDALYLENPHNYPARCVLHTKNEAFFSGFGSSVKDFVTTRFLDEGAIYYGGKYGGYLGTLHGALSKEMLCRLIEETINHFTRAPISVHTFLFPFRFDRHTDENGFANEYDYYAQTDIGDRIAIQALHEALTGKGHWSYERFSIEAAGIHSDMLYNEYAYFYDYIRDVLYNKAEFDSTAISNFYRRNDLRGGEWIINTLQASYALKIESVTLRLFRTGVAILAIELHNERYHRFDDILRINDYGRRVHPPFIKNRSAYEAQKNFLPRRITIKKPDGNDFVTETFVYDHFNEVRIGDHIMHLLGIEIFTQCKCRDDSCSNPHAHRCKMRKSLKNLYYVQPSLDDRMFVHCWTGHDAISERLTDRNEEKYLDSDIWYRYVFVDGGYATVQNDPMRRKLLRDATYDRWSAYGTLYGLSRYSFMLLTDRSDFSIDTIRLHMESIYFQMSVLLLANRTSILRFSDEIAALTSSDREDFTITRLDKLYARFLRFYNRLYFHEVSHQDQGIELYDLAMEQMRIKQHMNKLDGKFAKLFEYANLKENERETEAFNLLSLLISVLGIPSLILSIFSLGVFDFERSYRSLFTVLGVSALSGYLAWIGIKEWLKRRMKGGRG